MLSDLFYMSLQSLKRRKVRSWLTMIGIFIGIAAVVSLISLGQGLQEVVIGQFSIAGADVINVQAAGTQMGSPGTGTIRPLSNKELSVIKRTSGVDYALGYNIGSGKVEFNNQLDFAYIGSFSGDEHEFEIINLKTEQGRLLKAVDRKKVIVGIDFTDENKFGKPVQIGSKLLINDEYYEVIGIKEKRGSFIIDSTITMPREDLVRILNLNEEEYSAINLKVQRGADINEVKKDVEKELRKIRDVKIGEEDFSVETSESILDNLKSTLFGVQLFVYIIAGISIVVGGIGIMNTMYTSVLERRKDIGIMKAIGAKNSTIFGLFFIEAGLLGTVGGIIGILLGTGLAKGLAYAGQIALGSDLINANISVWLMVGSLAFSFIIGTISGLLPAMQAAKMHPVRALRN